MLENHRIYQLFHLIVTLILMEHFVRLVNTVEDSIL